MLATDHFVYIHQPKTGGTFVTKVLFRLQDLLHTEELRSRSLFTWFRRSTLKHGTCRDIPAAHRHRQVLSTIRHPLDLYVSEYEFGWWKRKEYTRYFRHRIPGFAKQYPHFPDLSFEEFLRVYNRAFCKHPANKRFDDPNALGWVTERFFTYFARHPWRATQRAVQGETAQAAFELFDLHFIRTGNLNQELHAYLLDKGCAPDAVEFILGHEKVLPGGKGRSGDQKWPRYYAPDLEAHVRQRERLLFQWFPAFNDTRPALDEVA